MNTSKNFRPTAAWLNFPRRFPAIDFHLARALAVAYSGGDYRPLIRRARRIATRIERRREARRG